MQTLAQLREANLPCFPCQEDKAPKVSFGQDWRDAAKLPLEELAASDIGGIPIPIGIVIIDLDLYKGITREQASAALGCVIPWEESLIQTTRSGGEHHAFRVDYDVNQRGNYPINGFDTKVGGKGYICFGVGYSPADEKGVLRLADIDLLPRLPAEVRSIFEVVRHGQSLNGGGGSIADVKEADIEDLRSALAHISPWCSREQWLSVGMGLKSALGDSQLGFEIFDKWSRGDFWSEDSGSGDSGSGVPNNYDRMTQFQQWGSFKAEGSKTVRTIFYEAQKAGWESKDPRMSMDEILRALGTSSLGLLSDVDISNIGDISIQKIQNLEPKRHRASAIELIEGTFREGILRINDRIYCWSGKEWVIAPDIELKDLVWKSLPQTYDTKNIFSSIYEAFLIAIPRSEICRPCKRVFFRNGVLNLNIDKFEPHNKDNLNLGTLAIGFNKPSNLTEWEKFLICIFGSLEDDRVRLLQEIFGWLMITHNLGIEKYIALVGVPRAGKGIILRILMMILGRGFCGPINFSSIGTPQGHAALWKYNVVIDMEAKKPKKEERTQALDTLQKITSNEILSSRRLYKNENLEGEVNSKLIIACNQLPYFLDDSGASANRVNVLVFDKSFLGKEDPYLLDRLKREVSGIGHWGIQGLKRLVANHGVFTIPSSSIEAIADLETASKPLTEFIDDHIELDSEARCFTVELYDVFKRYKEDTNFTNMSRVIFIKALKETLLAENVSWERIRIGTENKRGAIGIRIVNPLRIPISAPPAPIPVD